MAVRSDQIRSIQVLRAIAACAVVFYHSTNRSDIDLGLHSSIATHIAHLGNAGVDLFFLISGFLMTHLHREQFGLGTALTFLRRRLERIVPLYWILGAFGMAITLLAPHMFSTRRTPTPIWTLGNFLFFPTPQDHVIVVGWTLDYEMYFYAIFALCLFFKRGLLVLSVWLLVSYGLGLAFHPHAPWLALASSGMLLEFLAGAAIALLYERIPACRRTKASGWALLLLGTALLAASDLLRWPREWKWGVPLIAVFLGALWIDAKCRGPIGRALVIVGNGSYSVYLFQVFALPSIGLVLKHTIGRSLMLPLSIAIFCVGGCAMGVACWYSVERPIGRWIRNRRSRDRSLAVPGVSAG